MNLITDEEVRAARTRLLARGDELRERLSRVRSHIHHEDNPLPRNAQDAAIVIEHDDILGAVERSTRSELERIDHALRRMDAGGFAICERCGREIGAERLRVVPHATRCHDCEHEARLG